MQGMDTHTLIRFPCLPFAARHGDTSCCRPETHHRFPFLRWQVPFQTKTRHPFLSLPCSHGRDEASYVSSLPFASLRCSHETNGGPHPALSTRRETLSYDGSLPFASLPFPLSHTVRTSVQLLLARRADDGWRRMAEVGCGREGGGRIRVALCLAPICTHGGLVVGA